MQKSKEDFKKEFRRRLIQFSVKIINLCQSLRRNKNLSPIADQLIRSATSVGANVIEAKSSSSRRDYIHFFEIALKSANETKYWLLLIRETGSINRVKAQKFLNEADEIAKIIGSSVLTLKNSKENFKF